MDFIYRHDNEEDNELLSSLKGILSINLDLPMLILEFASFKPKKGNFDGKLSDEVRDKIETILNLVTEFK